jgi:AcrR family transcriptional regulator
MRRESEEATGAGREAASKERRRARIVQAATALLDERGAGGFSVDEVASRAGVSRRTVFNHFGSIDHLVVAVGTDMLSGLIDSLRLGPAAGSPCPAADSGTADAAENRVDGTGQRGARTASDAESRVDGSGRRGAQTESEAASRARADSFAELVQVLRTVDLVTPMIRLTRALGGVTPVGPGAAAVVQEAMSRVVGQLAGELSRRHPEADPFAVELMVAGMIGGVVVTYDHWARQSRLEDTPESRRIWSELVETLIDQTGRGPQAGRK